MPLTHIKDRNLREMTVIQKSQLTMLIIPKS